MHDFELAMGDRGSGKQGFFLFQREMCKLVVSFRQKNTYRPDAVRASMK